MKISRESKAGVIVIIAILAFWWLFQFLKGDDKSTYTYYVKYDNVNGLEKSESVMINGLKVGTVESITPIPTKNHNIAFVVALRINKNYTFSKNSIAQINSNFMSGAVINLVLAKDNAVAKSGDTLKGVVNAGIVRQLDGIVNDSARTINVNIIIKSGDTLKGVIK